MAPRKKKTETNEALRAELTPFQQESMTLLKVVTEFKIETQEQANALAQVALGCAAKRKDLEERLAKITDPAKALIDAAKAEFKPAIDTYKAVELAAKDVINKHLAAQKQTEQAALQAAAAAPALAASTLAVFDQHVEAPLPVRTVAVFSVTDEVALKCAVARSYLAAHPECPATYTQPALAEALQVHMPVVKRVHESMPVPGCLLTSEQRTTL